MIRILLVLLITATMVTQALAAEKNISAREAKALMASNRNILLLDVRTPQEFSQGRLPGAVLLPIGDLERRIGEVPRNKSIVVYCTVGSRSKSAAKLLVQKGYTDVYNISFGLLDWYRNGYPVQN